MSRLRGLEKPIPVAIAGRNLHGQESALRDMGVKLRNRIGMSACDICRIITSSGNATAPRSFSERTTFGST